MKSTQTLIVGVALISLSLPACTLHKEESHHESHQKVVGTSPKVMDVVLTQDYVCQIRSRRHINVRALEDGYLEAIPVKEGQAVKKGELLFQILPTIYAAKLDAEKAEVRLAQLEYDNTLRLFNDKSRVVSLNEVALYEAKLARAKAKLKQAQAEMDFTTITAPFDGIIDRFQEQQGSLIKERDILTTLSDNGVMWVYFNVPEKRYLEYMTGQAKRKEGSQFELVDSRIEVRLADGSKFKETAGNVITIEGTFNNETGNIPFRADFPNPDGLLRHGQTGTVLIHHTMKNALVIPQRATFEILDKRYVWVVGEDRVAHQRLITVENELDDIFIIKSGLEAKDKIVLEGVREVHEGDKVEYDFRKPEEVLKNQKHHAE